VVGSLCELKRDAVRPNPLSLDADFALAGEEDARNLPGGQIEEVMHAAAEDVVPGFPRDETALVLP